MFDIYPDLCYTIIRKGKENPEHQKGKQMKVYIVVGNKTVYGVFTNEEEAVALKERVNLNDECGGGYGHVACIEEAEVK